MQGSIELKTVYSLFFFALFAGCTSANPSFDQPSNADAGEAGTDDGEAGTDDGEAGSCTPNTFIECASATAFLRCDDDGEDRERVDCPAGQVCVSSLEGCAACSERAFYQDRDRDRFGDPEVAIDSCEAPPGYVADKRDCDDDDPAAHPGQTAFFAEPSAGKSLFDYDCDGTEEREEVAQANCQMVGQTCEGDGWSGPAPECGADGVYIKCVKGTGMQKDCRQLSDVRTQRCR